MNNYHNLLAHVLIHRLLGVTSRQDNNYYIVTTSEQFQFSTCAMWSEIVRQAKHPSTTYYSHKYEFLITDRFFYYIQEI